MPDQNAAAHTGEPELAEIEELGKEMLAEREQIWEQGICRECGSEDRTVKEGDVLVCLKCRSAFDRDGIQIVYPDREAYVPRHRADPRPTGSRRTGAVPRWVHATLRKLRRMSRS